VNGFLIRIPAAEHNISSYKNPCDIHLKPVFLTEFGLWRIPATRLHQISVRFFGCHNVAQTEQFICSYGLNAKFRDEIEKGQLKVAGVDLDGEVRVVELSDHPFFVGTLYQPQISSAPDSPHPLIVAFLRAALAFGTSDNRKL